MNMKIRRVLLAAAAAVLASFAFSSCVNEAPEINYVVEYTHNSDFSSIIEAIRSQSTTIAQKLDAVQAAVSEGFMTMEEASDALKDALVESLENQNATLSDIEQAIASQGLLLADKLDVLTAAVNTQTATLDQALEYIDASIMDQTEALKAKMDLICEAIETGAANLVDALEAFEETMDEDIQNQTQAINAQTIAMGMIGNAIVRAINNGVTTLSRALSDIEDAIDDQTDVLEYQLDVIGGVIEAGATTIQEAIEALGEVIEDAIEDGVEDINEALDDFAEDLVEAIEDNTDMLEDIVDAIYDLIDELDENNNAELIEYLQGIINAIYESHGMIPPAPAPRYEVINGVLYMNQAAYDELMAADDVDAAFLEQMTANNVQAALVDVTPSFANRMNRPGGPGPQGQPQNASATVEEASTPVIIYEVSDYDDPEVTDDKLVKKVEYTSVALKFTVTGYGAKRPGQGNNFRSLRWRFTNQDAWSANITPDSTDNAHGGTATYIVDNVTMLDAEDNIVNTINFDYAN